MSSGANRSLGGHGSIGVSPAVSGGAPSSQLGPNSATVYAGGMPWVDEPPVCIHPKRNGDPCTAPPIGGKDYCVGHKRTVERLERTKSK